MNACMIAIVMGRFAGLAHARRIGSPALEAAAQTAWCLSFGRFAPEASEGQHRLVRALARACIRNSGASGVASDR